MPVEIKVFKTEQERLDAMNAIDSSPPVGLNSVKREEWETDINEKINALMEAKIGPNAIEPAINTEPVIQEPVITPPHQEPLQTPNHESDTDILKRRLETDERNRSLMRQDYEEKLREKQAEIEKLKIMPKKEVVDDPPPLIDTKMLALETELEKATSALVESNPEEDANYSKKIKQQARLQLDYQRYAKEQTMAQITALRASNAKINKENGDRVAAQKKLDDQNKTNAEQEKLRAATLKDIGAFQNKHDEFKDGLDYVQMYKEFDDFAEKVAITYWGKTSNNVTEQDKEMAMSKYMANAPILVDELKKQGYIEPKSLRKYNVLSEVQYLKRGWINDNGQWRKYTDGAGHEVNFPDMESAWVHLQNLKGKRGNEIINATIDGAKGAVAAMEQRAQPGELDAVHQKLGLDNKLKPEEALEKLNAKDSTGQLLFDSYQMTKLARSVGPNDQLPPQVVEYNKLLGALDQEPINQNI